MNAVIWWAGAGLFTASWAYLFGGRPLDAIIMRRIGFNYMSGACFASLKGTPVGVFMLQWLGPAERAEKK